MTRVLLDHCVPRRVRDALHDCDSTTAFKCGWAELTNGELLKAAEEAGFGVLITADKNLRYQQNLPGRRIAIIELPTNTLPALLPHFDKIREAVSSIGPGEYLALSF